MKRLPKLPEAVVRLFVYSIWGDILREQFQEPEKNPALGLRAIRFGLRNEDVMRTQVRAIKRAAEAGKLKIVLPMVADVSDVRRRRTIIDEEAANLTKKAGQGFCKVSIGAMIEVRVGSFYG